MGVTPVSKHVEVPAVKLSLLFQHTDATLDFYRYYVSCELKSWGCWTVTRQRGFCLRWLKRRAAKVLKVLFVFAEPSVAARPSRLQGRPARRGMLQRREYRGSAAALRSAAERVRWLARVFNAAAALSSWSRTPNVNLCVCASAGSSARHGEQPDERRHHQVRPNLHQQSQVSRVCDQGELLHHFLSK